MGKNEHLPPHDSITYDQEPPHLTPEIVQALMEQRFLHLEKLQENLEQQLGLVIAGYTELTVLVNALADVILEPADDGLSLQDQFTQVLAKYRKEMMTVLGENGGARMATTGGDAERTVEDVAE